MTRVRSDADQQEKGRSVEADWFSWSPGIVSVAL